MRRLYILGITCAALGACHKAPQVPAPKPAPTPEVAQISIFGTSVTVAHADFVLKSKDGKKLNDAADVSKAGRRALEVLHDCAQTVGPFIPNSPRAPTYVSAIIRCANQFGGDRGPKKDEPIVTFSLSPAGS